jgi:hypothetical protein
MKFIVGKLAPQDITPRDNYKLFVTSMMGDADGYNHNTLVTDRVDDKYYFNEEYNITLEDVIKLLLTMVKKSERNFENRSRFARHTFDYLSELFPEKSKDNIEAFEECVLHDLVGFDVKWEWFLAKPDEWCLSYFDEDGFEHEVKIEE